MFNQEYADYFDEAMANTNENGSLSNFKMRYFDIRFSNICNFKCRTCGSGFSTQWEQEDQKSKIWYARSVPKNDNLAFLEEIKDQVDNLKIAYFAGGEPLITEEHYILLEEMIRRGATGVQLRYNTNISNLKFKDKDLLGLWSKFDLPIDIYASIDHYGERAEYIRHGTDWGQVETNLIQVKSTSFVKFQLNTVLSAFNYLTIKEFYQYLKDKNLYTPTDYAYLFHMTTPTYYSAHMLPPEYKVIGRQNMETAIQFFSDNQYRNDQIEHLQNASNWVELCNTWDEEKAMFKSEITRLDGLRGESFEKVFPELAGILTKE
jgi:sulfatase maturation enzyme AslB (radical SAM superfamily)